MCPESMWPLSSEIMPAATGTFGDQLGIRGWSTYRGTRARHMGIECLVLFAASSTPLRDIWSRDATVCTTHEL
jgi:hypothetical protein